jgi:glycosyltransferase involved in cell wall biosynthesis
MKIALVAKSVYPTRGGVELHVHNLALEMVARGNQVQVFIAKNGVEHSPDVGYPVRTHSSLYGLYSAFAKESFDVVHAHGARSAIASGALVAGNSLGLRTVFTPHCFYPPSDWQGGLKRRLFDPTVGKLGMRHAHHIICLTENDRRDAIDCGAEAEKIRIIPNAIRPPQLPAADAVAEFRQRHQLGAFLLSVGRLHRVKRGDFLISALTHLPTEIQLLFIGPDGGCLEEWRTLADKLHLGDRVRFLGSVSDSEVLLAYRGSAALVMASAYEGLPTVLLEAMALDIPVIAADSGGISCLIEHGINGLLYPYGDQDTFSRNVKFCLARPQDAMLERAHHRVLSQYSWPANAGRIAELYENCEA